MGVLIVVQTFLQWWKSLKEIIFSNGLKLKGFEIINGWKMMIWFMVTAKNASKVIIALILIYQPNLLCNIGQFDFETTCGIWNDGRFNTHVWNVKSFQDQQICVNSIGIECTPKLKSRPNCGGGMQSCKESSLCVDCR